MKDIVILLEEKSVDHEAGRFIKENIREVLGDTVRIHIRFLADMEKFSFYSVDLILVMVHKSLYKLYRYIQDYYSKDKILLVSRTLSKKALSRINRIPPGKEVLVANRSDETTADMIRLLYELEIIHLDLIPYGRDTNPEDFEYIITAGVIDFPINSGAKVVNVGYRQLGTQTFLDIFSRLDIQDERLARNLSKYIQQLPLKYNDDEKRYLLSQMVSKTLEKVMETTDFGILVTDLERLVLYCNQKARNIFQVELQRNELFDLLDNHEVVERMFSDDFQNELVRIDDEYVMLERHLLVNEDTVIGVYFECQTAKRISDTGSKLSAGLRKSGLYAKYRFDDIIYHSQEMAKCLEIAKMLAKTNHSILISGESGSGKEMFAQSIHNASECFMGPFIAVNCAAFPESLLESELFGYEGGAFTGSKKEGKAGFFELASGGSIFLDEIGDMPFTLQAKLLRVLQEKKIMRIGSDRMIDIDIRVLSASNKDLKVGIEEKNFRADLYYRLAAFTIYIPPLRNRKKDILPLFYEFVTKPDSKLSDWEEELLVEYQWPGNVRELQNAAAYFDIIGNIGSISRVNSSPKPISSGDAKERIVEVVGSYQEVGIGRTRILEILKGEGILLSQKRFETIAKELLEEQIIVRGRGRSGIRLNPFHQP